MLSCRLKPSALGLEKNIAEGRTHVLTLLEKASKIDRREISGTEKLLFIYRSFTGPVIWP